MSNQDFSVIKQALPVTSADFNGEFIKAVNARDIHTFMGVSRDFSTWITALVDKYGFCEGEDYLLLINHENVVYKKPRTDYIFNLDTAKELAMVQNNDKGRQIRQYFIAMEKEARKPQREISKLEALQMAIESEQKAIRLEAENKQLALEAKIQEEELIVARPKAVALDNISKSDTDYTITQAAKLIDLKPHAFGVFLRDYGYMYYSAGKNTPVQRYVDSGILKIKMVEGRNGVGMYPQVYVTSKGVAYFARVTKEAI